MMFRQGANGFGRGVRVRPTIPSITVPQAHVMNVRTGEVYYSKYTGAPEVLASTTKLMTAYVLLQNRPTLLSLQETVTITSGDIVAYSYNMIAGDVLTLHALMANMLLPSDNAAADAIARTIGKELLGGTGTEAASKNRFLLEMNNQARSIGMTSADFVTASGLETCYATPAEMNKLLSALHNNAIMLDIWRHHTFLMPIVRSGSPTVFTITLQTPMDGDPGFVGGKGGQLTKITACQLWEAPSGDLLAITVLGAASRADRVSDIRALVAAVVVDYTEIATPGTPFTPAYLFDVLGWGGGWWDGADTANMWQDSAGTTPVTASSQPLGKWTAKASDVSLSFSQSTSGSRPTYSGSGTVTFDGTDDYLDLGATSFSGAKLFAEAADTWMVIQKFKATNVGAVIAKAGGTTSNRTFHSYVDNGAGAEPAVWIRGSQTSVDNNIANGAQRTVNLWWDGTYGGMSDDNLNSRALLIGTAAEEAQNINLGARTGGTAEFLNGSVQQIVLVDRYDQDYYRRLRDWSNGASVNAFRKT